MNERDLVVLASLLHGLSNVWERAGLPSPAFERASVEGGPRASSGLGEWRADFIERFLPEAWLGDASSVLFHPEPVDRATKLVAVSQRLAAGPQPSGQATDGIEAPQLVSLFSHVVGPEAAPPGVEGYYALEPLS